jgi:hypothetical protein
VLLFLPPLSIVSKAILRVKLSALKVKSYVVFPFLNPPSGLASGTKPGFQTI